MTEESYSYHGPTKDMNLRSVEENMDNIEPYVALNPYDPALYDTRSYFEWLFPEREDGSRQVDDHTIMTAEAWIKMLEDAKEKVALSVRKAPVYPPWYFDMLSKLSVADERENLATTQRRGYPMYFTGGHRMGRTRAIQWMTQFDEWAGSSRDRIDIKALQNPEYVESLKEGVLEQFAREEAIFSISGHRRGSGLHAEGDLPDHLRSDFTCKHDTAYSKSRLRRSDRGIAERDR